MGLNVGDEFVREYIVGKEHTARHIGSGEVEVLSTPSMILFIEETCRRYCDEGLGKGETTVGTRIDVYHVKPAPTGAKVTIKCKLMAREGRRLTFWAEVYWGSKLIGYGIHERFIVDKEKFLSRVKEVMGK